MKKVVLLAAYIVSACALFAQPKKIKLEGSFPSLYIIHKVTGKENLNALARMYNTNPQSIAAANKINTEDGLNDEQLLRIPLTTDNFIQDGQIKEDEALVPLYYTVKAGDNLYRISNRYNKVNMESMKEWNNLSRDVIILGQDLIVGHLKVKKDKVNAIKNSIPQIDEEDPNAIIKKDNAVTKKEPVVPIAEPEKKEIKSVTNISNNSLSEDGIFNTGFKNENLQQINGDAATFKTTSGWNDKKFYVLMNDVEPGTIVKITAGNRRAVFAKVLGSMPEMKENNGLLLRLSNAAAASLEITDQRFTVNVSYPNSN